MNVWGNPHRGIPLLPKLLTFAGAIPLLTAVILMLPYFAFIRAQLDLGTAAIHHLGIAYMAIITAFLGGSYWGIALTLCKQTAHRSYHISPNLLFIWSNAVALISWGGLLIEHLLVAALLAQWMADAWLVRQGLLPQWWIHLRNMISPLVIALLICLIYGQ